MYNNFTSFKDIMLVEKALVIGDPSRSATAKENNILVLAGGGGCFTADTLVKTENGYKKIIDITNKDKVYTINEETEEIELKTVEQLVEHELPPSKMMEIEFDDGTKVRCTEDHEFYVEGKWVQAKDL